MIDSGNVIEVVLAGMVTKRSSARAPVPTPKSSPRSAVPPKLIFTRVSVLEGVDRVNVAKASFEVPSTPVVSNVLIETMAESSSSIVTVAAVSSTSTASTSGAPVIETGVRITVSSNSTRASSATGITSTMTDSSPAGIVTVSVTSVGLYTTPGPLNV